MDQVLPNTLNVEFVGAAGEIILQALDLEGVAVSAGAACHSGAISPSHVLTAMGRTPEQARGCLRFSVGLGVDEGQIDHVVSLLRFDCSASPGSEFAMTSTEQLTPRKRVVVAMSGGVDSSLAAALAAEHGFEVIGVTMHLSGSTSRCCSLDDVEDARQVAKKLGVKFFVANYADEFQKEVIEVFADSYAAGRTPIPCVACNKRFKFDHLLARANVFGATRVATGHYARIDRHPDTGVLRLWRARDLEKDQTYFLFQLDQEQLAQAWFPLGDLTKAEVRERARELGLADG